MIEDGDDRILMQEEGLVIFEVWEKTFKVNNNNIILMITACCNGNGNCVLVASSIHRRPTIDFETTTERVVNLWKHNQGALRQTSLFTGVFTINRVVQR